MWLLLIPTILIFLSNTLAEYSDSLTICLRMKLTHFPNFVITLENKKEGVDFLQVGVRDDGTLGIRLWVLPSSTTPLAIYLMSNHEASNVIPVHLYPRQWHHFCMHLLISSKQLMAVLDGQILQKEILPLEENKLTITSAFLKELNVKNCQNHVSHCTPSSGTNVTDMSIWGKELSPGEMLKWTKCIDFKNNAMKSWIKPEAKWEKLIQNSEVCTGVGPKSILLPWCMKFDEAKLLCEKYRGHMTTIVSSNQQRELFSQVRNSLRSTDCTWHNEVWTGFSDEEEEGNFVDVIDGSVLDTIADFMPFFVGQPNGGSFENCASADAKVLSEKSWYDARCDDSILSFCTIYKNPLLQIRGLSGTYPFDTQFTSTIPHMLMRDFNFNGFKSTIISYDNSTSKWMMKLSSDSNKYATTNGSLPPYGTKDYVLSEELGGGHITLNINACDDTREFNCQDGSCIMMEKRCDSQFDCIDGSDEIECKVINTPVAYLKHVPGTMCSSVFLCTIKFQAKEAQVFKNQIERLEPFSFLRFSKVSEIFRAKFQLSMVWLDPRLDFFNLKNDSHLNIVTLAEADLIWYPAVVFLNTQNMDQSIHDSRSTMTVIRNGNFTISPKDNIHNNHIYSGKDNNISMFRTYTIDFECNFFIHFYPFDIQQCNMNFILGGNAERHAELKEAKVNYRGDSVDLIHYYIVSSKFAKKTSDWKQLDGKWAVQIQTKLGRRIMSQLVNIFLPTIIICIVCYFTNYFEMSYFGAAIAINGTSLLCLTSLFTSVADSLPRTPYLKLIDYWFIICLCYPMLEVLLHAIIDEVRSDKVKFFTTDTMKDERWWKKASMWVKLARVWLPLAYIVIATSLIISGIFNVIFGNIDENI